VPALASLYDIVPAPAMSAGCLGCCSSAAVAGPRASRSWGWLTRLTRRCYCPV